MNFAINDSLIKSKISYFKKPYIMLISIFVFSTILLEVALKYKQEFNILVPSTSYLAWHNVFELGAVLVSITIFLVSYYTYNMTLRLRTILFGTVFLVVGCLDTFHLFSFKGMPVFMIENTSSNRATTFWVLARLISGFGFLILSFISTEVKVKINKFFFVFPSIILIAAIFITVTYYPQIYPAVYIDGVGLTSIKKILEYVVIALLFLSFIKFFYDYIKKDDNLSIMICGSLMLGIFSEYAFTSYSQVYDIFNYIGHIYKVLSYFMLFKVIFVRNVQRPYIELFEAQTKLRNYADNLDRIIDQRTMQLKRVNKRLMDDLEYARDIQKAMLPTSIPDDPNISFQAMYYPAERLSGDFYDIFKLDDEHLGFYICDVAGHGVPAAMLTVFLKQCIDSRRDADMNSGTISFPSMVLHGIFDSFNNTNFKNEVYMVLIYAIYNIKTKKLIYCSAGMNMAPILIEKDGTTKELAISGLPICKMKDIYDVEYMDTYLELNSGDKLIFYTDGLVDAQNIGKQKYSYERFYNLINKNSKQTGEKMLEEIKHELFRFIDGKKITDDITFFILEIL